MHFLHLSFFGHRLALSLRMNGRAFTQRSFIPKSACSKCELQSGREEDTHRRFLYAKCSACACSVTFHRETNNTIKGVLFPVSLRLRWRWVGESKTHTPFYVSALIFLQKLTPLKTSVTHNALM